MVVVPVKVEEEGADDDNAASLASERSSSQVPSGMQLSTSQASPSQVCDRRPKAESSTSTGKRVNESIIKLAEQLAVNTGVQDRLASAVQEGSNERLAFCQLMGLEACTLSEELWTKFIQESFQMIKHFRQLQAQQPVPPPPPPPLPPQPAQHPAVQQHQQSVFVVLVVTPSMFRRQKYLSLSCGSQPLTSSHLRTGRPSPATSQN